MEIPHNTKDPTTIELRCEPIAMADGSVKKRLSAARSKRKRMVASDPVHEDEEARATADDALRLVGLLCADGLTDEDRPRHADAEHGPEQEEEDRVGVGGRGERGAPQIAADPDRVHRAVERLEDVAPEDGQREDEQRLADGPLGEQRACLGRCSSHGFSSRRR